MKLQLFRRWTPSFVGAVLVFGPGILCIEAAPALSVSISQIMAAPDGSVQAVVSATDADGKALSRLAVANFRVVVRDQQIEKVTVSRVAAGGTPLSIVLAIDVSGSMKGGGLTAAVKGALAFVDRLNLHDLCALVVFGSGVQSVTGFTEDHARLKTALADLKAADSKTYLYQAAFDAYDLAAIAPTNRTAIVLLTDGKDDGSPLGLQVVVAKATVRDVPVFSLAYGSNADLDTLRRIAAVSRGMAYVAPGIREVAEAYRDISDRLQPDYLLAFTVPDRPSSPFGLSVALKYQGQEATANLTVTPVIAAEQKGLPGVIGHRTGSSRAIWITYVVLVVLLAGAGFYWRTKGRLSIELAKTMVPPRVWLEVVKGADAGQKSILFEDVAVIGRDGGKCQIVLKNDPLAGRQHARLRQNQEGQFVIEDLGSQNGTLVNGVRIKNPVTLQTDDRIVIGLSELLFIDQR